MLWKVTREGLEPSWLFGTCHAGVMLEESLPESSIPLVEEASLFVSEVDTSEVNMFAMPEELFLPEGQTVESLLGQEVWKELVDELDLGFMARGMNRMQPFVVYSYVSGEIARELGDIPLLGNHVMDMTLENMAESKGVEAVGLETMEDQMRMINDIGTEIWLEGLRELTEEEGRAQLRVEMAKTLAACWNGDVSGVLESFEAYEEEVQGFNEKLLYARNRNWIPPLEGYFREGGGVFVAVGAGHLLGPNSVVSMLQDRGWTVEQQRGVTVDRERE